MPWMTKRVLDAMGPPERHVSSLTLLRRRGGVTFLQTRGPDGEYIWNVQSLSCKKGHVLYKVRMFPEGTTAVTMQDTKEVLICSCNGFREIVKWKKGGTCIHCLAVSMSVTGHFGLFPIEVTKSDALQPAWAVGIATQSEEARNQAYAEAAGFKSRPVLVSNPQPFGSSTSHGAKNRVALRGNDEPQSEVREAAAPPAITDKVGAAARVSTISEAREILDNAVQGQSLMSDPFADIMLNNTSDHVVESIATSLNLQSPKLFGRVLCMLPAESLHKFGAQLIKRGEQLHLQTCYTYDSEVITDALVAAGRKGDTHPQILVDRGHYVQGKTTKMPQTLQMVSESGCRVFLCKPTGRLHAKFLLVDGVAILALPIGQRILRKPRSSAVSLRLLQQANSNCCANS